MAKTILAMAGPKIVDRVVRACSLATKIPGSLKPRKRMIFDLWVFAK
jgi:hypothetical protein